MMLTDIAQYFSIGQFSQIQPCFSEDIVWEIVGEQRLLGIDQVLKHCQSIKHYFKLTPHEFQIQSILQAGHHVIIQGEAYFHNGNQTTHISACDVYNFSDLNQLVQVQSYCISI
jgi:hypothetical protein